MRLPGAVDIAVNFHSRQLLPHLTDILERARQAQLAAIVATGTSLQASRDAWDLAKAHPGFVFSTAGVHPHVADQATAETFLELKQLLQHSQVVAVGECGLDFNRNLSGKADQRRAFEAQLELALSTGKPLFLHCRDAFEDFYAMVKPACAAGARGVVHCFTGNVSQAEKLLALGLDIGITGWVTDPVRGESVRKTLPHVPLQRMHLETDAPYLGPRNMKKRRPYNEPANVLWVGAAVADLLGRSPEEVVQATAEASARLFDLDLAAAPLF